MGGPKHKTKKFFFYWASNLEITHVKIAEKSDLLKNVANKIMNQNKTEMPFSLKSCESPTNA
jgi:hypothetical protein